MTGYVGTWRIIPFSKWLITMISKSPKDKVVPLPNGRTSWRFFMGVIRSPLTSVLGAHPPSRANPETKPASLQLI